MSSAALTLFKSLIHEKCFPQLTWKRPGKNGVTKIKIQTMVNIQNMLLKALQLMDRSYTIENLQEDIVYKILPRK